VLDPPLGQFGPFELHEVLGIGGMGTVYKAWDSARRQIVAVKVVAPQYAADISVMARYRREMAAGGAIRHPHLRACLAAEVIDGKHCLVMEYIDGNDLSVIVARRGALAVPDACEVVRQAAEALHFAHCRGLVHRDVKPSNLILDHAGRVKVLDLGLALLRSSLAHRPHAHDADEAGSVTSPGQILGTADFMAPEQALEPHAVDARTDVYALGCTLYYLLAGRPPFSGAEFDTPGKKMVAHVTRPLPPLAESKREIPLPLWSVIDRATAKVPDHRLGNAAMLAVALKPLSAGSALSQLD
jgi:serine/threonine protein kinase